MATVSMSKIISSTCVSRSVGLRSPNPTVLAVRPLVGGRKTSLRNVAVSAKKVEEVAVEAVFEATGVPLVDELLNLPSIQDAVQHSVKLAIIAIVGIFIAGKVLDVIGERLPKPEDQGKNKTAFNIFPSTLKAICKPTSSLLPFYGFAYLSTLIASVTQVAAIKMGKNWNSMFGGRGKEILESMKMLTQVLQDATEVIVIVGTTWSAVRLKNYLFSYAINLAGGEESRAARLLSPVSGALTYFIYFGGFMASLATCGINVAPLLASVGGAGVIIGLAAQSVIAQLASSVTLFASPPFSVGDKVKFIEADIEGTILSIQPMKTVLRLEDGTVLYVQNAKVVEWMVNNKTARA